MKINSKYQNKDTEEGATKSDALVRVDHQENVLQDGTVMFKTQDKIPHEEVIRQDSPDMVDKRHDFWLCYQEFSAKAEEIINLAVNSLRQTLYSTCTPDFAEVHAVVDDLKSLRDWLPIQFDEVDEEILNTIARSVGNSLVHWLLTSRNVVSDPQNSIDLLTYVSSQKHAPAGMPLETMEFQSIIITIASLVHEYLIRCHHYRTTGETQRHPVPIKQLVESLDPPVTDRLKSAFPDVDPELVESVASKFTEDVCGYLIDFLIGTTSSKRLEVPLVPILAIMVSHILESETLREDTQDLQNSANVMMDSILAKLRESLYHKSFLSSGATALIVNLDPQIHETLREGFPELDMVWLDFLAESITSLSTKYLSSKAPSGQRSLTKYVSSKLGTFNSDEFNWTKLESVVESIESQIKDSFIFYVHELKDPSLASDLVLSLDPPIVDRISHVFPDADPKVLESVSGKFTENLISNLMRLLVSVYGRKELEVPLIPLFLCETAEIVDEDIDIVRPRSDVPDVKELRSDNDKKWDLMVDNLRVIVQSLRHKFYNDCFRDPVLTDSLSSVVRARFSATFPYWSSEQLDEATQSTVTAIIGGLTFKGVSETLPFREYIYSRVREILSDIKNDTQVSLFVATVTSLTESINHALRDIRQNPSLASELVTSLDLPLADKISDMYTERHPFVLEHAVAEITHKLTKKLPELLEGSENAFYKLELTAII